MNKVNTMYFFKKAPTLLVAKFSVLCAIFCANAQAQQSVNESMDVEPGSYIDIEHLNGKAQIIGWNKDEVSVSGELGENTEKFIFRQRGNDVIIKVEVERTRRGGWNWGKGDGGDDLVIYVPIQSRVSYTSVNANVELSEIEGDVSIDVVNGQVDVRETEGELRLESVNGDIDFGNVVGEVVAETVNGSIRGDQAGDYELKLESVNGSIDIKSTAPEVIVETVNGDIELTLSSLKEADLNTVNGSVEASMFLDKSGDVRASSVGGTIELDFQDDVSARFNIEAHAGGRIINKLTDDKMQKAKYGPRRWLSFTHEGGDARVEVSTVSGRVVVE